MVVYDKICTNNTFYFGVPSINRGDRGMISCQRLTEFSSPFVFKKLFSRGLNAFSKIFFYLRQNSYWKLIDMK